MGRRTKGTNKVVRRNRSRRAQDAISQVVNQISTACSNPIVLILIAISIGFSLPTVNQKAKDWLSGKQTPEHTWIITPALERITQIGHGLWIATAVYAAKRNEIFAFIGFLATVAINKTTGLDVAIQFVAIFLLFGRTRPKIKILVFSSVLILWYLGHTFVSVSF
jgi:hypothetical protein